MLLMVFLGVSLGQFKIIQIYSEYIIMPALMVTPCTDWYLIFTGIAKGNVALGASILPINFILQLLLLPFYIFLIGGSSIEINILNFTEGIIISLFIPLLLASIFKKINVTNKGLKHFKDKIILKVCD